MVLTTQIPVACVGVHTNSGHALKFSTRALTRSHGWDAWLPWQELPLPIPQQWHPRALHCLRAYQLHKLGSALPGDSPSTPRGRLAPRAPFRGSPVPTHCPRGLWCPGPRTQRVSRAHYLTRPPMDPWPTTADKPGARGTHSAILTVRSHAPSPSTGLLHPSKRVSSLHSHQQQNDFHLLI